MKKWYVICIGGDDCSYFVRELSDVEKKLIESLSNDEDFASGRYISGISISDPYDSVEAAIEGEYLYNSSICSDEFKTIVEKIRNKFFDWHQIDKGSISKPSVWECSKCKHQVIKDYSNLPKNCPNCHAIHRHSYYMN